MAARIDKACVSGNKVHRSIETVPDCASNNEMLMKFNYPPQNKTNTRKVGVLMQSVARWTDCEGCDFPPPSGFHSNTMSSLLSTLDETLCSPEVGSRKLVRNRQHESDFLWQGIQQKILSPQKAHYRHLQERRAPCHLSHWNNNSSHNECQTSTRSNYQSNGWRLVTGQLYSVKVFISATTSRTWATQQDTHHHHLGCFPLSPVWHQIRGTRTLNCS